MTRWIGWSLPRAGVPSEFFPKAILEQSFSQYITSRDKTGWFIDLPDDPGVRLLVDDADEISGFSITRPPGDTLLYEAIIAVLKKTNSVLYWPGTGCVIANPSVRDDMPQEMLDALGEPTVTDSPEEILDCIRRG